MKKAVPVLAGFAAAILLRSQAPLTFNRDIVSDPPPKLRVMPSRR